MRVDVGDKLPVDPGDLVVVDLLHIRLQVGGTSAPDEGAPFFYKELFASGLGLGDGVGHEGIVVATGVGLYVSQMCQRDEESQ